MLFHPIFFQQKRQESLQPGAACLKAHQHSLFEGPDIILLAAEAVSFFLMNQQSQKKHIFFGHVLMDFHPTFSNKNYQNHPNQEPCALKPISIAYLKALA